MAGALVSVKGLLNTAVAPAVGVSGLHLLNTWASHGGLGFRAYGLGSRVEGVGFRV